MGDAANALSEFKQRTVQGKIILTTPRYTKEYGGVAGRARL
jgi:hypothetical protein